jgi:DGQHR domain-containing protein
MSPPSNVRRRKAPLSPTVEELRLPALEVHQGPTRTLYTFAVDGKQLPRFATVSRVHRDGDAEIRGYQRPEVLSHIASIRRYLESDEPMLPNALVIAFDKRVTFEPASSNGNHADVRPGTLVIPVDAECADEDKPGWVVDGQQRSAAIREARIKAFPICVTAFITDSDAEQRSQFILVNSTKPLPKGLIHELLPTTTGTLPAALQLRRFPAALVDRLNYEPGSPLERLIHTPTTPEGVIKDNSILRMIENSLNDGALYAFRDPQTGGGDAHAMLALLTRYWRAVRTTFPDAWGQPPRRSRLMHGVGIVSMGFVMDAIVDRYRRSHLPSEEDFAADLALLKEDCRWTGGSWRFGPDHQRSWNDLQNTPRDIQLLTNHLLFEYRTRVWSGPGLLHDGGARPRGRRPHGAR